MNTEEFDLLKMDYIDGTISEDNLLRLKNELSRLDQSLEELDEMKTLMANLDKNNAEIPMLDIKLEPNLITNSKESKLIRLSKNKYLMVAIYTIVVLGAGTLLGSMLTSNSEQLDKDSKKLIQMINNNASSVGTRLEAINLTLNEDELEPKIIEMLLRSFNTDENVNVRLSALRSLSQLSSNEKVRAGLIESILNQESAIVQISLLKVMLEWHEKESIKYFTELLKKEDTELLVINEIESALDKI